MNCALHHLLCHSLIGSEAALEFDGYSDLVRSFASAYDSAFTSDTEDKNRQVLSGRQSFYYELVKSLAH